MPEGVAVFPRGERHLKDIDEPERVYELDIEGVATAAPAEAEESPPAPPEEAAPESREQPIERRMEVGARLTAEIQEQVLGRLEQRLRSKGAPSPATADDDADVDDIAARSASLGEQIRSRVESKLRAKGISLDENG